MYYPYSVIEINAVIDRSLKDHFGHMILLIYSLLNSANQAKRTGKDVKGKELKQKQVFAKFWHLQFSWPQ